MIGGARYSEEYACKDGQSPMEAHAPGQKKDHPGHHSMLEEIDELVRLLVGSQEQVLQPDPKARHRHVMITVVPAQCRKEALCCISEKYKRIGIESEAQGRPVYDQHQSENDPPKRHITEAESR